MSHRVCWCGSTDREDFSAEYVRCRACGTLVSRVGLSDAELKVADDESDFYGKKYWLEHQNHDLGFPNIYQRAKNDLTDRNLHWLKTLLKYKAPPAKVLELGCSHGSFVALLREAGYDASGMEMSPWVVDFAKKMFDIPMLVGPLEDVELERAGYDVIALMDVLEHLSSPKDTLTIALNILKPDGLIMVQMPEFPGVSTFEELQAAHPSFLGMLLPDEHIYLYSQSAARRLFHELGAEHLVFEKPFFPEHDMFFVVSRQPIETISEEDAEKSIETPKGRFVQALLEQDKRIKSLNEHIKTIDADRRARLDQIHALTKMVHELQAQQQVKSADDV